MLFSLRLAIEIRTVCCLFSAHRDVLVVPVVPHTFAKDRRLVATVAVDRHRSPVKIRVNHARCHSPVVTRTVDKEAVAIDPALVPAGCRPLNRSIGGAEKSRKIPQKKRSYKHTAHI